MIGQSRLKGRLKDKISILAMCVLAVGLVAAGCGSSSSDGNLSKAEFATQANAICTEAQKKLTEGLSGGEASDFALSTADALQAEVDQIGALGAPSSDAAAVEEMLDRARKTIAAIEANPKDVSQANPSLAKAEGLADRYGLKACLLS
jgi:uncharacterized membrane protein